jgi:hypothetical protein
MKVKMYRDRCTSGHVQARPFSRNLAILWGTKTLSLSVRYHAGNAIWVCHECYI